MESRALLDHLSAELAAFKACLTCDLTVPVVHCGDWTLYDLADHLGRQNLWAAAAVTDRHGDHQAPPPPRRQDELVRWFDATATTLLSALDRDPSLPAWTFRPPHTVGFWQRRRCLETLIHRWDAEHALGLAPSLDPALASEGVAEVFDTMAPRQIDRGRAVAPRQAVRLVATDTGSSWTHGPGDPVAVISAPAAHLLLMLWCRLPSDDGAIRWEGDRAAGQEVLQGPLVS
jgi:uncharacterized protein (TIGR03083 family)